MSALNLQTHGRALKAAHQAVLDSQQQCAWAVFGYDRGTPDLKVVSQSTDSGSDNADDILAEFQDEFSDSKCLFGFVKAQDPNSRLPKIAFVSWCGQGVPVSNKGMFFGHVNDASRFLRGFHVQIDARHDDDVSPDAILRKLRESSGSQY
ncbi:putative drebrin family b, partial [Ramicandelaber brevisporus]